MPNNFKSITEILKHERAFSNFNKSVREQDVLIEFFKIFPDLKKTVKVSNINKGILFLNVENSVLRNEIHLHKNLLVEKINKYFNSNVVNDLKFTNFRQIQRKKSD
jgi:hypothetical protein